MTNNCVAVILNYMDYTSSLNCAKQLMSCPSIDAVIIVDNDSPNESYSYLNTYADNDKLFVLKTDHNGGYGYGNNAGVRFAIKALHAEYVLILNPDVFIENEAIASCIDSLASNPDLGLVSPEVKDISNTPLSAQGWKVPNIYDEMRLMSAVAIKLFGDSTLYTHPNIVGNLQYVGCVSGACLLYKASAFLASGGYDEDAFLYNEESMMGFKLRERGIKTAIVLGVYYTHEHSGTINQVLKLEQKLIEKNKSRDIYVYSYLKPTKPEAFLYSLVKFLSFFDRKLLILKRVLINKDKW